MWCFARGRSWGWASSSHHSDLILQVQKILLYRLLLILRLKHKIAPQTRDEAGETRWLGH